MDDAALVGSCKPVDNAAGVLNRLASRESAAVETRSQSLALQQLHGGVDNAILLTEIVNGQNVGVRQCRYGASFALEAFPAVGRSRHFFGQYLERDFPPKSYVLCDEYLAHAAAAERRQHTVVAECRVQQSHRHNLPQ